MSPYDQERVVRVRRKLKQTHYCQRKGIYRREQLQLTIPSRFKDVIEPFLNKDLKVDVRREGNSFIIDAKPIESTREGIQNLRDV